MVRPHGVGILLLPGVLPLDAAIPAQAFVAPHYRVFSCGPEPMVRGSEFNYGDLLPLDNLLDADTVIVPGYADHSALVPATAIDALRSAHQRGARVASICTGAFALAAAGLLDARPATTHWRVTDDLRRSFPLVDVRPAQLFIDDGDVLTSAGVMAGLDLCLHIVRLDHGAHAATERGRALVSPPRREATQTAYRPRLAADPEPASLSISALCDRLLDDLSSSHRIDDLAASVHMSRRTFIRRFVDATGSPPRKWIVLARLDAARALLETSALTIDAIGVRTGLGPGAGIRSAFHTHLGLSPNAYRTQFRLPSRRDHPDRGGGRHHDPGRERAVPPAAIGSLI